MSDSEKKPETQPKPVEQPSNVLPEPSTRRMTIAKGDDPLTTSKPQTPNIQKKEDK